ncbi:MAG: hypothetical protein A3C43_04160 [Candidatus Schekmanbacteria bacterium RIFCSPHIGHO2_02_FULL_38_11]|uniref:Cytochrome b/b6 C-terminal region profile domain-containing protein n=1 Tax=Candidatus Schekmanbacteria bacterium RIFCSPLOWO2_12_FULL_38_15 TaxID=1817883 RepID=A0A1F7SFI5_9BACT|nr:MAG: hypothetical protein A2043_06840 [Candidatus Schekmanbacteria bacterium GWA2_38_9]OGL48562.1 MAG: hypothetical protein A3H37_05655 [Candidatus Schekmanbacteria bacterium RIFCSPLOWO2_02_FULL_38_14]OGL52542.1 MAG: hypothetical protein A3G31_11210 [Candidatus Schekmanbacteria bacterium RIFCSPLOWO2_12_FULL_38_15]OGL54370.1 MAG: hypothetical protein A3C43_04160 [Candidatus Schekmanbacteria bacterium RIFCSPHIGHO2_02_FULL_38_11]
MSDKLNESKEKWEEEGIPFFPNHLLKEVIVAFMLIALLLTLATYYPAPMEPPADPFTTPEHIKPEWYFLAAYQGLKAAEYLDFLGQWAPKVLGVFAQGLVMLLLVIFPFVDRNPERNPRKRKFIIFLGIAGMIGFIILTIWGYVS